MAVDKGDIRPRTNSMLITTVSNSNSSMLWPQTTTVAILQRRRHITSSSNDMHNSHTPNRQTRLDTSLLKDTAVFLPDINSKGSSIHHRSVMDLAERSTRHEHKRTDRHVQTVGMTSMGPNSFALREVSSVITASVKIISVGYVCKLRKIRLEVNNYGETGHR